MSAYERDHLLCLDFSTCGDFAGIRPVFDTPLHNMAGGGRTQSVAGLPVSPSLLSEVSSFGILG